MSKAGSAVSRFFAQIGLKAPWKFTGPTSSPEYLSHLPKAVDYRRHGPASPPVRAVVPHAEPEHVYNIKYYTRDSRRAELPGGSKKLVRYELETQAKDEALEALEAPPTPNSTARWHGSVQGKFRSIQDYEGGGYTA